MRPLFLVVFLSVISATSVDVAFGQSASLRFDGAYRRTGNDKTTQHLRFYPDGTVISAITPSQKTPAWLSRDFPGLTSGSYKVKGNRIQLTLHPTLPDGLKVSTPRTLHYTGSIRSDCLQLRRNGFREPWRFDFAQSAALKH